ncbi:MAG: hypothetical protein C4308_07395 [Chitinophagaceae bacterium]
MLLRIILPVLLVATIAACSNSGKGNAGFCDTACLNDTIKFIKEDHKLKPYVYISAKNCNADSIIWSYAGKGVNKKMGLEDLLNNKVKLNKNFIKVNIFDTSHAWVMFNDCLTGRGYVLKLPFASDKTIERKSSGINNLDPKFKIEDGLVAYTDRGNIFVRDMATDKQAMMTFGKNLETDYDALHKTIDSVKISRNKIWVKVKINGEWKELQKEISLQ